MLRCLILFGGIAAFAVGPATAQWWMPVRAPERTAPQSLVRSPEPVAIRREKSGTAFFVDNVGHMLTARHAAEDYTHGANFSIDSAPRDSYLVFFNVSKILPFISSAISAAGSGFWHSDNGLSQKLELGNISNRLRAAAPRHVSGSFT